MASEKYVPGKAIEKYYGDIVNGKIVACKKIIEVAKYCLWIYSGGDKKYHFDGDKAARHVNFIQTFCSYPKGEKGGKPFQMEQFQTALTEFIFGIVDDEGYRMVHELFEVIGRKNGKSTWAAAVSFDMLLNDSEQTPLVVDAAVTEDQAMKTFGAMLEMRSMSPVLKKAVAKRTGNNLYCKINLGKVQALTGRTKDKDGFDPSCAILDEIAAWEKRDMYDLLIQSFGARRNWLMLETTTFGFVRGNIFDAQYEYASKWIEEDMSTRARSFLPVIYELDEREEWHDEENWIKANPGIGTVKSWDYMRQVVAKAKQDAEFYPSMMVKDFNVVENSSSAWLSYEELHNPETYDIKKMGFKYAIVGFDASDSVDLTAACALMMRPGDNKIYAYHQAWIPGALMDRMQSKGESTRDNAPYMSWINRGLLHVVPGNNIPREVLFEFMDELKTMGIYTYGVGYDAWGMSSVKEDIENYVGKSNAQAVRQGSQTLSDPMKRLRADYRDNRIVDNANPIAEWCRSNVMVNADTNGNIKPNKKDGNEKNRIDVFASELDAYVMLMRVEDEYLRII